MYEASMLGGMEDWKRRVPSHNNGERLYRFHNTGSIAVCRRASQLARIVESGDYLSRSVQGLMGESETNWHLDITTHRATTSAL
jgi:hypothetical protein